MRNNAATVHRIVYEDIALPLISDGRWEPDTIFLIFEEDFRFTESEGSAPVFVKVKGLQEVVGEVDEEDDDARAQVPLDASSTVTSPFFVFLFRGKK